MERLKHTQTLLPQPPSSSSSASDASFPIIAVAVIGIFSTVFLLVSYYVFVINCCLSWHRIDLLRRFSFSRRRSGSDPSAPEDLPAAERSSNGLDESAIRSIPTFRFRRRPDSFGPAADCAVCLNEFREDEKLRGLPNCGHAFHIDCIDVWLQSNSNCPLCRSTISCPATATAKRVHLCRIVAPTPSPRDRNPFSGDGGESFLVIELGEDDRSSPAPTRWGSSSEDLGTRKKMYSVGDECVEVRRTEDERLSIQQPMRRSFSLDSSNDPLLRKSVMEIAKHERSCNVAVDVEGCSIRVRRSLFSFGHHGKGVRNSVMPTNSESKNYLS